MSDAIAATESATVAEYPDPIELFTDTFQSFSKDFGPYLLAGLGQFAVMVPVMIVFVMVLYFGMFAWAFGGMFVFSIGMALAMQITAEGTAALLGLIAMMLWYAAGFVLLIACSLAIGAAMAPLNASLVRRVAAYQRDGTELDFSAAFSDTQRDLLPVITVALAVGALVSVGMMFLYLPGMIALVLFGHASLLVALNGYGAVEAMKTSMQRVMANPSYYAMFWLLYIVCAMIVSYVPIIGPMYLVAVHVRAHRRIYGDGPELLR